MLFRGALKNDDGDGKEFMCPQRSEPCLRSSLLLLEQSLSQVRCLCLRRYNYMCACLSIVVF